jgi:hypothetical protein
MDDETERANKDDETERQTSQQLTEWLKQEKKCLEQREQEAAADEEQKQKQKELEEMERDRQAYTARAQREEERARSVESASWTDIANFSVSTRNEPSDSVQDSTTATSGPSVDDVAKEWARGL